MKRITLLFLALLLAACATAPPPATAPHEILEPTSTPTEAPTPTATATATLTPEITVTEGSFWEKAGVPAGLEISLKDSIFYAKNQVGQDVEVGKMGEDGKMIPEEWLEYSLSPEQIETEDNVLPYDPIIALKIGQLNATPFPPEVQACKQGDVAASSKSVLSGKEMGYSNLYWSDGLKNKVDRPAKIIGYFKTVYPENGQQLWGKVVEWLTPDGITYTVNVSRTEAYTSAAGDVSEVFPLGLTTTPETENSLQPFGTLTRAPEVNSLLKDWISTGCPPTELQAYFLYGYPGIKSK